LQPQPLAEFLGPAGDGVEIIRPDRISASLGQEPRARAPARKTYEFVAMMDADDISHPERLAKQVAFLKASRHRWSARGRFFDENTREVVYHFRPPCDLGICEALFLNSCIMHPTWMMRTRALRDCGLYSTSYPAAEDYELLRRISKRYDLANLPEFLLEYSVSMSGISMKNRRRQLLDRLRIQAKHFDPWHAKAWFGVARTLAMFVVPRSVVSAYRADQNLRVQPS
jgi:hypothetical protein